ncbi:DAGKc domain-containing protein [Podarcis lilfordi]|uniref:DAGKc domain-containing protein n=1 Tax=Podarcis lilfordi TaxID=74358 RepID=A0AA35LGU3_9SAUR|nr:DAGKc domain-containing protein [Podarcis lilfordi]
MERRILQRLKAVSQFSLCSGRSKSVGAWGCWSSLPLPSLSWQYAGSMPYRAGSITTELHGPRASLSSLTRLGDAGEQWKSTRVRWPHSSPLPGSMFKFWRPAMPTRLVTTSCSKTSVTLMGSTDCICFATVGTNDPITSALHIVIGDSQPMDVCSIWHNGKLLRYSVSLVGYGFYGDVVSTSEKYRWMGPMRYTYAGAKALLRNCSYEGTVEFQVARTEEANPRDQTRCRSGCVVCSESSKQLPAGTEEENLSEPEQHIDGEWQQVQGRFLAVNLTSMSSACPKSPEGLSPCAHLADGTADLILVHECSALSFLRHLTRHTNGSDQFDLPFVSVYRVRAIRFTSKVEDHKDGEPVVRRRKGLCGGQCQEEPPTSCWTCDGETLQHTDISVRVHGRLIHLFARGIEQAPCRLPADPREGQS